MNITGERYAMEKIQKFLKYSTPKRTRDHTATLHVVELEYEAKTMAPVILACWSLARTVSNPELSKNLTAFASTLEHDLAIVEAELLTREVGV